MQTTKNLEFENATVFQIFHKISKIVKFLTLETNERLKETAPLTTDIINFNLSTIIGVCIIMVRYTYVIIAEW